MEHNPLFGGIVGLTTASCIYIWKSERFNKAQKTFLLLCFFFPPLQWIMILVVIYYNNEIYKKTKEFTKELSNITENKKIDVSKSNLKELKDSGIISEEEYKVKIEQIENQKNELSISNSKEYAQLKSLLELDILTKAEFDSKVELLKEKKSNVNTSQNNEDYRIISGYSEGLALVIGNNLDYGYIDTEGKIVIDFIFEHAENFNNGIATVRVNGLFKKIDKKGNLI